MRPALSGARERAGVAARLARVDLSLARAWLRHDAAVRAALGPDVAAAYADLLAGITSAPDVARRLCREVPDHLARVPPEQRRRYLGLLRASRRHTAALPLLARTLPELLERLDDDALGRFLKEAVGLHEDSPRRAESFLELESEQARERIARLERGVSLETVRRWLSLYARAHCGRDVQIVAADGARRAFTDGQQLFLPERIERFGDDRDQLAYRVLTARGAGYLEFGTLELDLEALPGDWPQSREEEGPLARLLRGFSNPSLAQDLLEILENLRVETRVRSAYPGVARDMDLLAESWRPERSEREDPAPVEQAVAILAAAAEGRPAPEIADDDARRTAAKLIHHLDAVRAEDATIATTARTLALLYTPLHGLMVRTGPQNRAREEERGEGGRGGPNAGRQPTEAGPDRERGEYRPRRPDPLGVDLPVEARPMDTAPQTPTRLPLGSGRRTGSSYSEMAEFLERLPGPAGPVRTETAPDDGEIAQAAGDELETPGEGVLYPEWDAGIGDLKPDWVRLTEVRLRPGGAGFAESVRAEHGALIKQIRRAFEALRAQEHARVRGLTDGDEIDIDRAIADRITRRAGGSPDGRIYHRRLPTRRDVSVGFLVDMSSSTNEMVTAGGRRIIDIEKQALVLISEAVDALGDDFAIWGFSGYGRDEVAFYIAKDFCDPWDAAARERIGRISWRMENRDGAAIRHATARLLRRPARARLLILLSDGRPLDCGCEQYADTYAQEDVRVALQEARAAGVHAFCITVDPHGQDYLDRIYGPGGYLVIDRVERLPAKLPRIYRRLTR